MNELHSKNKKEYALLDFSKVNERGLKKLTDAFKRTEYPVAAVESDNKSRRKDGMQVKTVKLRFDDQQEVEISVGEKGDIIQTKINKKIVPISQPEKLASYAKDVAARLKLSAAAFARSLAKKTKTITDNSTKKPAAKSLLIQSREAQNFLTDAVNNVSKLKEEVSAIEGKSSVNASDLQKQKARYESEVQTTKQLRNVLANLESDTWKVISNV